jgi:hypothetical protein
MESQLTISGSLLKHVMATNPNPDRNKELMMKDHGTICLITDPLADIIMQRVAREKIRQSKEIKDAWTI